MCTLHLSPQDEAETLREALNIAAMDIAEAGVGGDDDDVDDDDHGVEIDGSDAG